MCGACDRFEARRAGDKVVPFPWGCSSIGRARPWHGRGSASIRVSSTSIDVLVEAYRLAGAALGGVVAGEGHFGVTRKRPDFTTGEARLTIRVLGRDGDPRHGGARSAAEHPALRFDPGRTPTQPHWQPIAYFSITSQRAHHAAVIPFADRYLVPGAKRDQFERWRSASYAYESFTRADMAVVPPRAVPGCAEPVRGRGLCRRHYYRATGYRARSLHRRLRGRRGPLHACHAARVRVLRRPRCHRRVRRAS